MLISQHFRRCKFSRLSFSARKIILNERENRTKIEQFHVMELFYFSSRYSASFLVADGIFQLPSIFLSIYATIKLHGD